VVSQPGEYWVEIASECYTHRDSVEIDYVGPQLFDLGTPDTVLCRGNSLLIGPAAVPGIGYLWQDGNTSSTYFVTQEGVYSLTAGITGCSYTDSIRVIYVDCGPVVWIPNVFTPNGDGDNDVFRPIFTELVDTYVLRIFDRWGKELFSTTVPEEGWNGNFKGLPCTDGTYFWTVHYTGGRDGNVSGEQHGSMVLAR
jgi:gliding motility-associated-like protein